MAALKSKKGDEHVLGYIELVFWRQSTLINSKGQDFALLIRASSTICLKFYNLVHFPVLFLSA